jgi:tetratricopeptide (TPR) repeat protein
MSVPARPRRDAKAAGRSPDGAPPERDDVVQLQLSLARAGIGLELSSGLDLGAAHLSAMRARLLGVTFPLDVSGGVERFRHRRSELVLATVEVSLAAVERFLTGLATDLLPYGPATARVLPLAEMLFRVELAGERAALSFDVALAAQGSGLVAYAHGFRGVLAPEAGLLGPVALAGRLLSKVAVALGGEARGARLELPDPLKKAAISAFVARGARLPARAPVALIALTHDVERLEARFAEAPLEEAGEAGVAKPHARVPSLIELDGWIGDADDALVRGELGKARDAYAAALERAPRHKSILLRLAELDGAAGRVDAALSWVRDAEWTRTTTAPTLELARTLRMSELWAQRGARGRARAGFERAGHAALELGETRLAARAMAAGARFAEDDDPQLGAMLDRALAADPFDADARARRARLRVVRGEDARAIEDLQHLEALARGRDARRALLLRMGEMWRELGRPARAIEAFERALRYAPDDPATLAGLGLSMIAAGDEAHGTTLLSRALALPGDDAQRASTLLALAHALADRLDDPPAAIARLREIPTAHRRGALARALEGAYRARLGDLPGATRAWSEAAEASARGLDPDDVREVVGRLCEGAEALRDAGDRLAAHGLAIAAAYAAPGDARAVGLARALSPIETPSAGATGAIGAREEPASHEETQSTDPGEDRARTQAPPPSTDEIGAGQLAEADADLDYAAVEARAEALLARFKGDPSNDEVALELADLLGMLRRDLELFALLAARYDEATPEERVRMGPTQAAVLERLAEAAEARGAAMEAGLYRDAAVTRGAGE